jgi:hypothetical protein
VRIPFTATALLDALLADCGTGNVGTTNSLGLADGLVDGTRSPAQAGLSAHLTARLIHPARQPIGNLPMRQPWRLSIIGLRGRRLCRTGWGFLVAMDRCSFAFR